jgi:hypothetical protein
LGSTPVVGDWNNDGTDTIGIVTSDKAWVLRNTNSGGAPDLAFYYGPLGSVPVVGDWNGDGADTIGIVASSNWSLRNNNSSGPVDINLAYGFPAFLSWK